MTLRSIFCLSLVLALAAFLVGCDLHPGTLASIQVSPSVASVTQAGTSVQFTATATYTHGSRQPSTKDVTNEVTWASSVSGVATIDASGVATAVNVGNSDISASMNGPHGVVSGDASLDVTVGTRALTSISIIPATGTQVVYASGQTAQFLAIGTFNAGPTTQDLTDLVNWQSSDIDVATINASGLATAVNCAGACVTNITAKSTAKDGTVIVATSNLTVTPSTGTFLPSLTVYPVGQGSGTIVSIPVGINCGAGASCTADFVQGSTVTLTATASSGVVLGFTSNCAPTAAIPPDGEAAASCTVPMGGNQTVGVIFNTQ